MSKSIEERLAKIEQRNQKVELDKAWETSWTRRLGIIAVTYLAVAAYLYYVVGINPWINALVPVIGFVLSTLTLDFIKQAWLNHQSESNS